MAKSLCLLLLVTETFIDAMNSDLSRDSCSLYFCKTAVSESDYRQCEKTMSIDEDMKMCSCTASPRLPQGWCDGFSAKDRRISVNGSFPHRYFTGPKMAVISKAAGIDAVSNLTQLFFKYLPLTNITDFSLSSHSCGSVLYAFQCAPDYTYGTDEGARVTLFSAAKQSKVQRLNLSHNCISHIVGEFSDMFPELRVLVLSHNLLISVSNFVLASLNHLEQLDLTCNQFVINAEYHFTYKFLSSFSSAHGIQNEYMKNTADIFSELTNLKVLNMGYSASFNFISTTYRHNTELRVMDLSFCGLSNITGIFSSLTKLQTLTLEGNVLSSLPPDIFVNNTELQNLNLKNNLIQCLLDVPQHFSKPINLDISQNCFRLVCPSKLTFRNSFPLRTGIDNITCHSCCLGTNNAGTIAAQLAESSADLRYNQIKRIHIEILETFAHLKKVYLSGRSKLNISIELTYPLYRQLNFTDPQTQIYISEYSFDICGFLTLQRINAGLTKSENNTMIRSNMMFRMHNITIAGHSYPGINDVLADQNVSNAMCAFTFYCPQNCLCHTQGIDETIIIKCIGRNLSSFPNLALFTSPINLHLSSNRIRSTKTATSHDWSVIKELHLDKNLLEDLERFEPFQILRTLHLQNNKLVQFSSLGLATLQFLSKYKVRTMLAGNPWQCDCDTPKIKTLLTKRNFEDFNDITCKSVFSGKDFSLQNVTVNDLCPMNETNQLIIKILLPIFAFLVVVIIAGIIIYYRYKELIKLWLFTKGYCLRFVAEEDIDIDKIYDAFVSYSTIDEEWVANNLVEGLENGNPSYKLCLHNRDWPAGEWILEQILRSVQQSRRTIIVLTNHFVNSDWSKMEFIAAYKQGISDQINRVLVVIPDEIPEAGKLGEELRSFITLNTYLKWQDPYFWNKLRAAMPRVRPRTQANGRMTTAL